MKKILVPTDFSKHSEYALEVACCIAKDKGSHIVLIHMMGLSEAVYAKSETQEYEEAMYYMKLAKKRFKKVLDKPYTKGIKITETVQNYKIFSEINTVAKEQNIELIVMGSHGTKGLNEVFVGSNTEKVVRTSEVPVLVIKSPNPNFKINKMVFACDLKKESLKPFINVNIFAKSFSAEIQYLYINTPGEHFLSTHKIHEKATEFMDNAMTDKSVIIYDDHSVESGILNYCENHNVDIIAIPTHGRKGLSHFFLGSLGEDLANHSKLPLLTFKI